MKQPRDPLLPTTYAVWCDDEIGEWLACPKEKWTQTCRKEILEKGIQVCWVTAFGPSQAVDKMRSKIRAIAASCVENRV